MDDQQANLVAWQSIPAGVLQAVSCCLPWHDILNSRLVCSHWCNALVTHITHIRVHIAAGCRSTNTRSTATTTAAPSTTSSHGAQNPGTVLQAGLQRLPSVVSVQLVVTEHTTAGDLSEALDVVGQHASIQAVSIWEVDPIHKSLTARLSYAGSLQLRKLPHVKQLTLRSAVTWSLDDIWQRVAAMITHHSASSSSCSDVVSKADNNSSSSSTRFPAVLQSLIIQSVSLLSQQYTCTSVLPAHCTVLPTTLQQLVTPLPGQKDQHGAIVCTLAHSHEAYVQGIAVSCPGLESLRLLGCYEGSMKGFGSLTKLTELHIGVGGMLRATQDLSISEDDAESSSSSFVLPLLQLPQLHKLQLTGYDAAYAPVKLEWLSKATRLQHVTASMAPSLQSAPSHNDVLASTQQLHSLSCRLTSQPSHELLAQVAAVGSQLTTLTLSRGDPTSRSFQLRNPLRYQRPTLTLQPYLPSFTSLHSLSLLSGPERLMFTIQDPTMIWQAMPQLQQLRLQGVGIGYGADSKPLQRRQVTTVQGPQGSNTTGDVRIGFHGAAGVLKQQRYKDAALDAKLRELNVLWLEDLPKGLTRLELCRYAVVVPAALQHQQPQLSDSCSSSTGGSSSSKDVLYNLEGLVLAVCCVLDVVNNIPAAAEVAGNWPAGPAGSSSSSTENLGTPTAVTLAPTRRLLKELAFSATAQLTELQLLCCPLFEGDVGFTCRNLAANLRILHLQSASWAPANQLQCAVDHVAALAAAVEKRQLQQLQDLVLNFGDLIGTTLSDSARLLLKPGSAYDNIGVGLFRVCCGFRSLRHLSVTANLQHCAMTAANRDTSTPGGSSSTTAAYYDKLKAPDAIAAFAAMPGHASHTELDLNAYMQSALRQWLCSCAGAWDASNLQHLCMLDIRLLVPPVTTLGDLAPGVLGRCNKCGGGVGLEAVRWFFKQALPDALLTCEVQYEELMSGTW